MNHRSCNHRSAQPAPGPSRTSEGAALAACAPDARRQKNLSFGEDFNSEHSFSHVAASVTTISIGSDPAELPKRRTYTASDRGVPSCVYLG